MLKSGKEHLEGLRDGRVVYIGGEQVTDVTRHPAFRNAAQSIADFYDFKADPARRNELTYEDNGERHRQERIQYDAAPRRLLSSFDALEQDGKLVARC